jgi:hypothetical protein
VIALANAALLTPNPYCRTLAGVLHTRLPTQLAVVSDRLPDAPAFAAGVPPTRHNTHARRRRVALDARAYHSLVALAAGLAYAAPAPAPDEKDNGAPRSVRLSLGKRRLAYIVVRPYRDLNALPGSATALPRRPRDPASATRAGQCASTYIRAKWCPPTDSLSRVSAPVPIARSPAVLHVPSTLERTADTAASDADDGDWHRGARECCKCANAAADSSRSVSVASSAVAWARELKSETDSDADENASAQALWELGLSLGAAGAAPVFGDPWAARRAYDAQMIASSDGTEEGMASRACPRVARRRRSRPRGGARPCSP